MTIKLKIENHLGTYDSEELEVTDEQYNELVESSKGFWYTEPSFHMWLEDGVAIFPPDIIRQSILSIKIIQNG